MQCPAAGKSAATHATSNGSLPSPPSSGVSRCPVTGKTNATSRLPNGPPILAAEPPRCPVTGKTLADNENLNAPQTESRGTAIGISPSSTQAAGIPVAISHSVDSAANNEKPVAQCPFGYTARSVPLQPFTCPRCRALFYDCVKVIPCQHQFCRGCIARFTDCPMCGCDVEGFESDQETQRLVNVYLLAHAHEHSVEGIDQDPASSAASSQASTPIQSRNHSRSFSPSRALSPTRSIAADVPKSESPQVVRNRAFYHLQLALRAASAGNLEAAKARASTCKDLLVQLLDSFAHRTNGVRSRRNSIDESISVSDLHTTVKTVKIGSPPRMSEDESKLCYELGVVFGKLGDMCIGQQPEEAHKNYLQSLWYLQRSLPSAEVRQAASITLNKIGDLLYRVAQYPAARTAYEDSLRLRRENCKAAAEPSPSQLLDVAVSLGKLADIDMACGNLAIAKQEYLEALSSARSVQSASTAEKKKALMELFEEALRHLEGLAHVGASKGRRP